MTHSHVILRVILPTIPRQLSRHQLPKARANVNLRISLMISQSIGESIPNNTEHAVSVTLPTWEATVGYEEGEEWVVSKMNSGYPRFFIHSIIQQLASNITAKYGRNGEQCMVFSSYNISKRCRDFIYSKAPTKPTVRVLKLSTVPPRTDLEKSTVVETSIGVVFFPPSVFALAKAYWQHSGEGISSRLAEYLLKHLFPQSINHKIDVSGDTKAEIQARRIQKISPSIKTSTPRRRDDEDTAMFIDQKFGRILDLKFAPAAKIALKRRITGNLEELDLDLNKIRENTKKFDADDVYLYPSGMASIFNCHQALLQVFPQEKSVCFGFPYVDTLNILKKFGPGVHFLGLGDDQSLEELEENLKGGMKILGLFCECPSNPLLKTPNLKKIRALADTYDFAVVVDDTVGNFINIHVLPYADMVCTSLTKVFSGDSNVMGGSVVLNKETRKYAELKKYFTAHYEDVFWAQDALVMERNSRDFAERSRKVNENTLEVVKFLTNCSLISKVYYPSLSDTKKYYDDIKTQNGGYGGLISFIFNDPNDAITFFNAMNFHKGPSLGTNFTLACPYTILAHYGELDEVEKWDIDRNLIRISVGIEDKKELVDVMEKLLEVTLKARS